MRRLFPWRFTGDLHATENPTPMSCSTQQSVIALTLRTQDRNSGIRGQAKWEKKGKSRQTSARPERKPNTKLRRTARRFPACFLSDLASSVSWRAESDSIEALYGYISASLTLPRLLAKKCNDEIVCGFPKDQGREQALVHMSRPRDTRACDATTYSSRIASLA